MQSIYLFYRINALYVIMRGHALICLLVSSNFKINRMLAVALSIASHYIGAILKLNLISAGVLELLNMIGSGSFMDSVNSCCGIDTVAIW